MSSPQRWSASAAGRFGLVSAAVILNLAVLTGCSSFFGGKVNHLVSVSPNPAKVGAIVAVKGEGFQTSIPPKASIGGKNATVLSSDENTVTVQVPEGSESGGITLDFEGDIQSLDLEVVSDGASSGGDVPVVPTVPIDLSIYENSFPGYKLDEAQSGTTEIDTLFPPSGETKSRNKALDLAEDPAYVFAYNGTSLTFASITGFQFQDPQAAGAAMADLNKAFFAASLAKPTRVTTTIGGSPYAGYVLETYPGSESLMLFGAEDNAGFMIRLDGDAKVVDEETAARMLADFLEAGQK